MKILLVNNHTQHLEALSASLNGHDVEIQMYQPGIDFHDADKDMVILSGGGGEGLEIIDKVKNRSKLWYQDEMNFVRKTEKPILGICMGFEVIVNSFGGKVHHRPDLALGFQTAHITDKGQKLLNHKAINQLEAHYWYVPEVPCKELEVLAVSKSGIEMVRHTRKKILGTQFHPEEGGTINLQQLLASQFQTA
jgi:GMP synthase-like glutamine amidotransferase